MQRKRRFVLSLAAGLALAGTSPGAIAAHNAVRIPNVTRWVRIFSKLELKLDEALRRHDAKSVSDLLSGNFEMRVAARPGSPIPRASWIQQSLANPGRDSALEQMAVHAYDNLAVVSFMWTVTAESQATGSEQVFVVDIWKRTAGSWKLSVRYAAPGGKATDKIPGGKAPNPIFEKRE